MSSTKFFSRTLCAFFSLGVIVLLSGCSTTYYGAGTPVVKKHAKRGYNKSYKIKGQHYSPRQQYEYSQTGMSSYYGGRDVFHGRQTSTGERFNKNGLTAAHKTLPLPAIVRVTNLKNGRSLKLRINDRGPFVRGRIIDVSEKAAKLLGFHHDGITKVRVECLVAESMMLARHYDPKKCNPYTVHGHKGQGPTLQQAVGRTFERVAHKPVPHNVNLISPPQPKGFQVYSTTNTRHIPGVLGRGTYIQVGTYSSEVNAKSFATKVATRMRVPCNAYPLDKAGGAQYHRVLVGPMQSQDATTKMVHELKIRNVTDAFVVVQD